MEKDGLTISFDKVGMSHNQRQLVFSVDFFQLLMNSDTPIKPLPIDWVGELVPYQF